MRIPLVAVGIVDGQHYRMPTRGPAVWYRYQIAWQCPECGNGCSECTNDSPGELRETIAADPTCVNCRIDRLQRIGERINTIRAVGHRDRALRSATRVWNIIDNYERPEKFWQVLANVCPWAFENPADLNSIRFTYTH